MSSRLAFALLALTEGCAWSCAPANPAAVVPPTIDTIACILSTVATDEAAGDAWAVTVADTVAKCATDATTIATVWAAHVHASVVDPNPKAVPPPDAGVK